MKTCSKCGHNQTTHGGQPECPACGFPTPDK